MHNAEVLELIPSTEIETRGLYDVSISPLVSRSDPGRSEIGGGELR
jgi:hypothetical protein